MPRAVLLLATAASAFDWVNPRYWALQAETAKLVGAAVRKGSEVLEVDAVDGAKNLYYLPPGCTVTQWLDDAEAAKDLGPTRQAAGNNGLGLDVIRSRDGGRKPPRMAPEYYDAALCLGALGRAAARGGVEAAVETCDAALKALKPDGRLIFVEQADAEPLLAAALDESDLVAECDAQQQHGAILGVVRRAAGAKAPGKEKGFGR
mmetsp:Transcript_27528/g.82643  ORF Transcript_27528/g.82643 Transcript_27528/m.82643 type:complete len:205 (+) Transcript_27528:258-872(+)